MSDSNQPLQQDPPAQEPTPTYNPAPTQEAGQASPSYTDYGQQTTYTNSTEAPQQGSFATATPNSTTDSQSWSRPETTNNNQTIFSASATDNQQYSYAQSSAAPQYTGTNGSESTVQPWQTQTQYVYGPGMSSKSKVTAAILAFFMGSFGIHNFYLGKTGRGVAQLLITIFLAIIIIGPIISWVWAIVEGAQILGSHPGSPYHTDGQGLQLQD